MATTKLAGTTLGTRATRAAVQLPPPESTTGKSLDDCLRARRSCRWFTPASVPIQQVSQLLWAAQGITGLGGLRTAPSAGALYPLHVYLIALNVSGLRPGAYTYDPDRHRLSPWKAGDLRSCLFEAAREQDVVETAPLAILLTASYSRSKREFGDRAVRLVHMEAGHAGQNVLLEATALDMGAIGLSNIDEQRMRGVMNLPEAEEPVYLLIAGPK